MTARCILTRQNQNQPPTLVDVSFGLVWGGGIRIDKIWLCDREITKYLGDGYKEGIKEQIQDSLQESEEEVSEGWIYNLGEW